MTILKSKKVDTILSGSLCTRCGKPRVVVDTYEEKVETSVIVCTITECSDPDCQKIVNEGLKEEEKKRAVIKSEQEKRELQRREVMAQRKRDRAMA